MTVKIFEGSGVEACPKGWYALYEHEDFNTKERGRVLLSDQTLGDLGAFGFDGRVLSVVNHTEQSVALHVEPDSKGFAAQVGPRDELRSIADKDTREIDGLGNPVGESRNKLGPALKNRTASIRIFALGSDAAQVIRKLPVEEGTYILTNLGSGKVLDVLGNEKENGANVGQYTRHGGPNQQWTLTPVRRDYSRNNPAYNVTGEYEIASKAGGKLLEVAGGALQDTANIQQWDRTDASSQRWWVTLIGDGVFVISNIHSGKTVDVTGASKDNSANVQQYTFNDTVAQKWRFERV
ncbi:RICIN domain-containing protein [Streptomyces olivoreticuli]|uniref:RICIN domain-containing protein n=1 Tax=Streptomyces olivoreticuli TaxID=68246 RepID=UPI000E22D9C1|nr:RICIN domain-containing protein [Streptomyces olivoreticuli]